LGQGGVPRYSRISDVVSALAYAGLAGARVINLSLGGSGYNPVELEMLGILHQLGILVVAAAGNGGGDGVGDNLDQAPFYPASYGTPNLIVVAAQDRSGGLAPFSNFGAQSVHLAAPGTDLVGADISRRTLFRETFEAPGNGWLAGSDFGNFSLDSWQFAGPAGGRYLTDHDPSLSGYLPYANLWARSPLLDLRGIVGTRLEFDSVLSLADDLLVVEASADGALWWNFATLGGLNNGYARQSIDLSDLDGLFGYFRFRLISNGAWQGLGVGIDNIEVSALAPFDASTPTFRFNSGTSFAAPLVSGVAALILSRRPDVSVAQLRACLLDSVRPVSTLAGKVVTGGMLDANEALRRADLLPLPPVITQGPVGRTVALGDPLTLSVVATGTPPLWFQWRKDGAALSGATSSTLTLATTQAGDAGVYAVVVTNAAGGVISLGATIVIGPAPTTHSADVNRDFRLGLLELTRVIELYNTRNAGLRTGCYAVSGAGSEDGFAPEPARANAPVATLARYHSADVNRDGRMGLLELTRVIELYNYRSAGTRTGQYRILAGSEDGFAAGA
jgi:subtilisin family serine protease